MHKVQLNEFISLERTNGAITVPRDNIKSLIDALEKAEEEANAQGDMHFTRAKQARKQIEELSLLLED